MSNTSGPLTITMSLRKACAVLPAVALLSGGIILSAPLAAVPGIRDGVVSNDSSAIVVPDIALTLPGPARILPESLPVVIPESLGTGPGTPALGGSSSTTLSGTGIPVRALEAYRRAATLTNQADPGCHIDWALIAAIGRVESDHARFGGNQLNPAGVAQPGIIGIALDGSNGTARITDSDSGTLDQDNLYDRAVGPMQFIPTTWRVAGVDANGDGVKNPQDITDAASATAVYLCSGPGDLTNPADLHAAILRYNHSDSYAALVTGIAATYRLGISALPASNTNFAAAANLATSTSREPGPVMTTMLGRTPSTSVDAPTPARVPAATASTTTASTTTASTTPVRETTAPTTTAPTTTAPTATGPTTTVPTTTVPTTTAPTTTVPTTTVPAAQVPTTTVPVAAAPTTTVPAAPEPAPVPTTTVPCVPTPAELTAATGSCVPLPCEAVVDPNAPAPTDPCPPAAGVAAP